jgi:hypothetical protein
MRLFGALEDFVNETLAQFPSKLGKLRFISEMRKEGRYKHWGLSKSYGDDVAQQAIAEAHSDTFEKALTTPVPLLADEDETQELEPLDSKMNPEAALPENLRGGTKRHFRWVLKVVDLLHRSHQRPNPGA